MNHSISDDSLRRFAQGTASPEESCAVVSHLMKGCAVCAKRVKSFARPDIPAGAYDAMFARLEKKASTRSAAAPAVSSPSAEELLAELDAQPESRREMLVSNSRRIWIPGLAELLRDRSHSLRYHDPRRMLRDAQLAARIAERLPCARAEDRAAAAGLQARCLFQLANALRIWGNLDAAEQAIASARACLREVDGDLLLKALLYDTLGALRKAQLRFQDSIWWHAMAISIYRDIGRQQELASSLVGQAIAYGYAKDPETALSLLLEAMPKIDNDLRLTLAACHAVVYCHIELGQVEKASLRLVELRSLYEKIGDPLFACLGEAARR